MRGSSDDGPRGRVTPDLPATFDFHRSDGNLLSDARNTTSLAEQGRWVYTWDAENRLIQMETPASYTASSGFYTKLTFEYNWEGKRIARHQWTGGTPSSPTFVSSKRWLYDGWNPVAEFTATAPGTGVVGTGIAAVGSVDLINNIKNLLFTDAQDIMDDHEDALSYTEDTFQDEAKDLGESKRKLEECLELN